MPSYVYVFFCVQGDVFSFDFRALDIDVFSCRFDVYIFFRGYRAFMSGDGTAFYYCFAFTCTYVDYDF